LGRPKNSVVLNSEKVRVLRENIGSGVTQEVFADLPEITCSLTTYRRAEQGKPITLETAEEIADVLGIDVVELILDQSAVSGSAAALSENRVAIGKNFLTSANDADYVTIFAETKIRPTDPTGKICVFESSRVCISQRALQAFPFSYRFPGILDLDSVAIFPRGQTIASPDYNYSEFMHNFDEPIGSNELFFVSFKAILEGVFDQEDDYWIDSQSTEVRSTSVVVEFPEERPVKTVSAERITGRSKRSQCPPPTLKRIGKHSSLHFFSGVSVVGEQFKISWRW